MEYIKQYINFSLYIFEAQHLATGFLGSKKERSIEHLKYLSLNVELLNTKPNRQLIELQLTDLGLIELLKYLYFEDEINDMI